MQMDNLTINRLRVQSPNKRTFRNLKPISKTPVLASQPRTIQAKNERFSSASSSPRKLFKQKNEDYDLCSSGVVLVMAKKLITNEKTAYDSFKKTSENWKSCQIEEEELFCQRRLQKYRIRESSRGRQKMWTSMIPHRNPSNLRLGNRETAYIKPIFATIEPWNLSADCPQLSDLF